MSQLSFATVVLSMSVGISVLATAQPPLRAPSEAYRLEFENAWVKVTRVHYGPRTVIAAHDHTAQASAYVYLNDGPPVVFKHEGLPYAGVTRPATRAGSFRIYKGIKEVHSVENPADTSSEFLRVEFKTEPREDALLKGKFFREGDAPLATAQRMHFENAQVRISRVSVAAGDTLRVGAADTPVLLVALVPTSFAANGGSRRLLDTGKTAWLETGQAAALHGTPRAGEVLRFDFKTRPVTGATNVE